MIKHKNKSAEELVVKGEVPVLGKTYQTMFGKGKVIKDFLPSPDELRMKAETQKVTIALTKRSIAFFKKQAKNSKLKYQIMIRDLIDQYAAAHK